MKSNKIAIITSDIIETNVISKSLKVFKEITIWLSVIKCY